MGLNISLSCTVSPYIFSVKYWRDFEIWLRGHSRSLKMVSIESLGTVSYLHSIATQAVSLDISTQYTNVTDLEQNYRCCEAQNNMSYRPIFQEVEANCSEFKARKYGLEAMLVAPRT